MRKFIFHYPLHINILKTKFNLLKTKLSADRLLIKAAGYLCSNF